MRTEHPRGAVEGDEAQEQGSPVSAGSNIKEGFWASRPDSEQVTITGTMGDVGTKNLS